MREIPGPLLERHFDRDGDRYHVRARLRRIITAIRPHNLVSSCSRARPDGGWDIIFCRNVIIYFDTPTTQRVLTQFHNALAPGGYLFLGYSESLFRLFEGFELTEVAGAFLYRRPDSSGRSARPREPGAAARVPVPAPPPAVRHVTFAPPERAHTPVPLPAASTAAPPRRRRRSRRRSTSTARWRSSRTAASAPRASCSSGSSSKGGEDLAVRLTLANLYGILRQTGQGPDCYVAALALEPLSAEAHLFYGIHLHGQAEHGAAARELQRALFLDPDLALAHYYLGRSFEGQKDAQRARLAYRNALEAFKRRPDGKRQAFLGYYPDVPEDGTTFARAAEYALAAL